SRCAAALIGAAWSLARAGAFPWRTGLVSASTARVRRYRERRKVGTRVDMFEVGFDDLDGLEALGQIADADDLDQAALSNAVANFVTDAIRRALRASSRAPTASRGVGLGSGSEPRAAGVSSGTEKRGTVSGNPLQAPSARRGTSLPADSE